MAGAGVSFRLARPVASGGERGKGRTIGQALAATGALDLIFLRVPGMFCLDAQAASHSVGSAPSAGLLKMEVNSVSQADFADYASGLVGGLGFDRPGGV
jgi:hypothetical protein